MTHLGLTHPIVGFVGFLISEVSRCWPWFLSIVIRFVMTPTWDVVNTTTIYTNNITCDCFAGTWHTSVAWDLVLHLVQKTSSWQSFLRWSVPPQVVQITCGLRVSPWMLVLGHEWPLASKLFTGPPLDCFISVSVCSWVVVKEFILLILPLLWVGSDIFKSVPTIGFGVDVGLVVPCCDVTWLTGGIGL